MGLRGPTPSVVTVSAVRGSTQGGIRFLSFKPGLLSTRCYGAASYILYISLPSSLLILLSSSPPLSFSSLPGAYGFPLYASWQEHVCATFFSKRRRSDGSACTGVVFTSQGVKPARKNKTTTCHEQRTSINVSSLWRARGSGRAKI